jgi:hypothetical protein
MSRAELFDNQEEQGVGKRDGHETGDNEPSRRKFIRNVAVGTAGAALAMSNLDRLRGASRLLERYTNSHVDGFLEHVRRATRSPQAKREFHRISSLILDAVDNDSKSRTTFSAVHAYLANPLVQVQPGQNAIVSDLDMVIGAGYLRAMSALQESKRQISASEVKSRLANPKAIFDTFESGFLNQLYTKTKAESTSNLAFAHKLADASSEARGIGSRLRNRATSAASDTARMTPASLLQGCDCTINGVCATWEECVLVVAIIVIVILVTK